MQKEENIKQLPFFKGLKRSPILILNSRPYRQMKTYQISSWLDGNRVGEALKEITENYSNIIFANAIPYVEKKDGNVFDFSMHEEGLNDLRALINRYKPGRIVAMGDIAIKMIHLVGTRYSSVNTIDIDGCDVFVYLLPDFYEVMTKNRGEIGMYKKTLETLLKGHKYGTHD